MAQTSAQKCYICTEKNSVFYCYECQHALCAVCRERHDKVPALSGHTITDINVIDLSNLQSATSMCIKHEKEYQFYCVKCSDIICGKCATSSHKGHSFSEISEVVSENREAAQSALQKLKSAIGVISSVKDTVRGKHLEKLHFDSQEAISDIISTFEELHKFTKSKKDIKITEVEDNERIEQQSIEVFLKNTGLIHDRYAQVFTALQNILCEKHDITFYKFYKAIDKDITFLDDIPKEPMLPCVPSLDKTMLYTEILEYIQSKTDTSLCKNCFTQKEKMVEILEENKHLQRDVNGKSAELKAESNEVRRLRILIKDMESKYAKKEEENKRLSKEIKVLEESIPKKYERKMKSKAKPTSYAVDFPGTKKSVERSSPYTSLDSNCIRCHTCGVYGHSSATFCKECGENLR
ncbi:unnamed protein product [Mytilus coruscus]|uniref:B box-type domain-containing protein n=1 Tax=Mytilus coruscus TaxID=42192 RepID=A0A6J8DRK0_MYTCO|nr:unnamed protein product [Mytilus coruscus]